MGHCWGSIVQLRKMQIPNWDRNTGIMAQQADILQLYFGGRQWRGYRRKGKWHKDIISNIRVTIITKILSKQPKKIKDKLHLDYLGWIKCN